MILKVIKRFFAQDGIDSAMVLSFNTFLALVPVLYLALSVFSISPYFYDLKLIVEQFLFEQLFLEDSYITVDKYINTFVEQTANIKGISAIFLLITAILLMFEIDLKINKIWGVKQKSNIIKRVFIYIFSLFLGPLLLGFSLMISSYILAFEPFLKVLEIMNISTYTTYIFSFGISCLGFALLYFLIIIQKIQFKSALKAGFIAALLLEILKFLLVFYVKYFPVYKIIYGAYSILPLLLLWVYLAWIVVLIGASFCYYFETRE